MARQYLSAEDVPPWGYAWAGLMLVTAVVNLVLAVMLDPIAWSAWLSVFTLGSKFLLFNVTFVAIRNKVRKARATPAAPSAAA